MAQRRFYFLWEEAERLRETYSSWLNKTAYTDKGKLSQLKRIMVKPKRTFLNKESTVQTYYVEFHFVSRVVDASHFLLSNGLTIASNILTPEQKKHKSSK